jgi:hypothetical protein
LYFGDSEAAIAAARGFECVLRQIGAAGGNSFAAKPGIMPAKQANQTSAAWDCHP